MLSTSRFSRRALLGGMTASALALNATAQAQGFGPSCGGQEPGIFASSTDYPLLQYPEGLVYSDGLVYVATYNVAAPANSRIFVFEAFSGKLIRTLGGKPGQELISQGALLGLTVDPHTGYLYTSANFAGQILQIRHPERANPDIRVYVQYPNGGGPEDMAFHPGGILFASDSNLGVVYAIPAGGGKVNLVIGPPGSGAPVSDNGLLQSPVAGLSPNGVAFSRDGRTLYVANTFTDSVISFPVSAKGVVSGPPHVLAQYRNDDLPEFPFGFEALVQPTTRIGLTASTPLNGPDGLAVDRQGRVWAASFFGDNLTVLSPDTGAVIKTVGSSAVTGRGLLNNPASITFVGDDVLATNLGIFTDGSNTNPTLPWRVARYEA